MYLFCAVRVSDDMVLALNEKKYKRTHFHGNNGASKSGKVIPSSQLTLGNSITLSDSNSTHLIMSDVSFFCAETTVQRGQSVAAIPAHAVTVAFAVMFSL